jgi:hypothetical protein
LDARWIAARQPHADGFMLANGLSSVGFAHACGDGLVAARDIVSRAWIGGCWGLPNTGMHPTWMNPIGMDHACMDPATSGEQSLSLGRCGAEVPVAQPGVLNRD